MKLLSLVPFLGLRLVARLVFLGVVGLNASPAFAAPLVVDLSNDLIRVGVNFDGDQVLMFGAVEAPLPDKPVDLIVTVMGPRETFTVRKKSRRFGLWINGRSYDIKNVPSFYKVASTRPLKDILDEEALARIEAGASRIDISQSTRFVSANYAQDRRDAFVRNMVRMGLYQDDTRDIAFLSNQLFRTDLVFPSNVNTGAYEVRVHLVQDGEILVSNKTPLAVRKVGNEAAIYAFAHNQALLYGIICVLLAIVWGYGSYRIFRKL